MTETEPDCWFPWTCAAQAGRAFFSEVGETASEGFAEVNNTVKVLGSEAGDTVRGVVPSLVEAGALTAGQIAQTIPDAMAALSRTIVAGSIFVLVGGYLVVNGVPSFGRVKR